MKRREFLNKSATIFQSLIFYNFCFFNIVNKKRKSSFFYKDRNLTWILDENDVEELLI